MEYLADFEEMSLITATMLFIVLEGFFYNLFCCDISTTMNHLSQENIS